jgi:hypothetical protein
MQTFLPYADYAQSAESLRDDTKRLGKQRVENLQIIKALKQGGGLHGGWSKHPASRMWENFELSLLAYQEAICWVWVSKGFKDTCWMKSRAFFTEEELEKYDRGDYETPEWIGDEDFHYAHRSSLVFKAPEIYAELFPDIDVNGEPVPYIWPGKSLAEASEAQKVAELTLEIDNAETTIVDGKKVTEEPAFMPS